MPYLIANLYWDRKGRTFDPERVIDALRLVLPQIEVAEGDQLQERVKKNEPYLNSGTEIEQSVLSKMKNDAESLGPAYAFSFHFDGQVVNGVVKRHVLSMRWESPMQCETLTNLKDIVNAIEPLSLETAIEICNYQS